jgi:hypothetical protein
VRRIIAAILALTALMGLAAVLAPAAFADGDPASDVLTFQSVFNPSDSGAKPEEVATLAATVQAANRAGYPIRVALINSSADLGTVTQLWEEAPSYAQYLGKELSYQFHGVVLVVMPQTDGLYVPAKQIPAGDSKGMSGLNPAGSQLAASATQIVARLAADNGVSLPSRLAVTSAPKVTNASSSSGPLIAFIGGLVAIAGAWALSLRLRPVRRRAVA